LVDTLLEYLLFAPFQLASPEVLAVGEAGVGADLDPVAGRTLQGGKRGRRVTGVKPAGNVGRRDEGHQLGVVGTAFPQVAVQIDFHRGDESGSVCPQRGGQLFSIPSRSMRRIWFSVTSKRSAMNFRDWDTVISWSWASTSAKKISFRRGSGRAFSGSCSALVHLCRVKRDKLLWRKPGGRGAGRGGRPGIGFVAGWHPPCCNETPRVQRIPPRRRNPLPGLHQCVARAA